MQKKIKDHELVCTVSIRTGSKDGMGSLEEHYASFLWDDVSKADPEGSVECAVVAICESQFAMLREHGILPPKETLEEERARIEREFEERQKEGSE